MILGLGGKLSGGKTVTAVRYCYRKGLEGKKVISNIKLNFPKNYKIDYVYMPNEKFIMFLKNNYNKPDVIKDLFYNSVLLLDEISNLLSARKSSSLLNELVTNFMMMLGKLNADCVYTFQVKDSQVDKRLREISQVYANCYRIDSKGNALIDKDRKLKEKVYIIVIYLRDLDILGEQVIPEIYDPSPFYNMYETEEIILLDRSKYMSGRGIF